MTRLTRGFVILMLAVCAAIGIGVAIEAGGSTPLRVEVSDVPIPVGDAPTEITASNGALALYGYPTSSANGPCSAWQVNALSLAIGPTRHIACNTPVPITQSISVVVVNPYRNDTGIRIARRNPSTGKVTMGPVVMHFSEASDTHPVWIVGDGSLWVYDVATPNGAELLRISETTGRIENTVHVPFQPDRPMLAVDDDGLWMAVQVNGGSSGSKSGSPIYHVAPGSDVATVVHRSGYGAFWITASGHSLWVDVPSFVRNPGGLGGGIDQELWEFQGAAAHVEVQRDVSDTTWQGVTAEPDGALVTFTSPGNAGEDRCGAARVSVEASGSRISRTIATLPTPISDGTISCELLSMDPEVATLGNAAFALAGTNQATTLWRVSPLG